MTRSASDPNEWTGNVALVGGEIKFRANGEWAVSWGGPAEFPADTAILGSNDNIAVDSTLAGDYLVNFNTETGIFSFLEVVNYASIGIIGDAVDGWEVDRDMVRSETDSAAWSLRTILKDGELKFRADDDWVDSWGGADFPSGIAGNPGVNTPITAGEYVITFNTITGAYNFEELVVFSTVGIIGTGTTIGDWDTDVDMEKDAVDEQLWTLDTDLVDGEIKFRAEDDWAVNWGPADQEGAFPSGTGVQDGANILSVAGTYRITLRSDDGSYSIDEPSSTKEPILKEVRIYPNPAQDFVNIELSTERIKGQVNIDIIDISGKKLISTRQLASGNMKINVSGLQAGNYFVSMYNKDFVLAKPITIVK